MVRIRPSGFTLIELVVTMMVVAIVSFTAIARFSGTDTFDRREFYDETLAVLRYAQKLAIAQRRHVCVTFSSTTVRLKTATVSGVAADCLIAELISPAGVTPFRVTARGAASFVMSPVPPINFYFDALGVPGGIGGASQTIQVSGLSGFSITVERETGYVHP